MKLFNYKNVILFLSWLGMILLDLFGGRDFYVNWFFAVPPFIFLIIFVFAYDEKILKIIVIALFVPALFLHAYLSLEDITCDFNNNYYCLARKALKNKDISFCEKYKGQKPLCYVAMSRGWHDISLCDRVPSEHYNSRYDCVTNIAVNTKTPEFCEKINYDQKFFPNRKECYSQFNKSARK